MGTASIIPLAPSIDRKSLTRFRFGFNSSFPAFALSSPMVIQISAPFRSTSLEKVGPLCTLTLSSFCYPQILFTFLFANECWKIMIERERERYSVFLFHMPCVSQELTHTSTRTLPSWIRLSHCRCCRHV